MEFKYMFVSSYSAPLFWGTTESEGAGSRRQASAFREGPVVSREEPRKQGRAGRKRTGIAGAVSPRKRSRRRGHVRTQKRYWMKSRNGTARASRKRAESSADSKDEPIQDVAPRFI